MKEKDNYDVTGVVAQTSTGILKEIPRLDFGASKERLMHLMEESNLSDKEFSQALGVSVQAVNKWRNGYGFPDYDSILPLSRILGVTVDDILSSDNESDRGNLNGYVKGNNSDMGKRLSYYASLGNQRLSIEL